MNGGAVGQGLNEGGEPLPIDGPLPGEEPGQTCQLAGLKISQFLPDQGGSVVDQLVEGAVPGTVLGLPPQEGEEGGDGESDQNDQEDFGVAETPLPGHRERIAPHEEEIAPGEEDGEEERRGEGSPSGLLDLSAPLPDVHVDSHGHENASATRILNRSEGADESSILIRIGPYREGHSFAEQPEEIPRSVAVDRSGRRRERGSLFQALRAEEKLSPLKGDGIDGQELSNSGVGGYLPMVTSVDRTLLVPRGEGELLGPLGVQGSGDVCRFVLEPLFD